MSQLVADIGGTNARFAIANELGDIVNAKTYQCADFENIYLAIKTFLQSVGCLKVTQCCLAIAAKIPDKFEEINMTNNHWSINLSRLSQVLEVDKVNLINDFSAISYALPVLKETEYEVVHQGQLGKQDSKVIAVIGPGTGLGVGCGVFHNNHYVTIPSEGGHLTFAAENDEEMQIKKYLLDVYSRVSYERIISGEGLLNLYLAMAKLAKIDAKSLKPSDIGQLGVNKLDPLCDKVMQLFFKLLGRFAGDIALTFNADEIFIGGGIAPRYIAYLKQSDFMKQFCNKGRFSESIANVAVKIITTKEPGLIGAVNYLKTHQ